MRFNVVTAKNSKNRTKNMMYLILFPALISPPFLGCAKEVKQQLNKQSNIEGIY